ncbi:MAG: OmpA family protein [SAR324 cluster bacterium]|nr:OmpA family protein [SAR324 cluster bacterium]
MQNCKLKSMIYLMVVVLLPFMNIACGPTEDEYMAKIDEVNRYKRLSRQRESEIVEQEKQIQKMGDSMKSLNENLFQVETEKKRALAQQETNKEHLDRANNQLQNLESQLKATNARTGKLEEELAETKNELESTEKQLAETNSQLTSTRSLLGRSKDQLDKTKDQVRRMEHQLARAEEQVEKTKVQLQNSSLTNKKLEENIRDYYLKITALEQKERALQRSYEKLQEREKELNSQIVSYNARLLEERSKGGAQRQQELLESLKQQLESDRIKITELSNRIAVRLDEQLLFDSGEAFIKASGFKVLKKIGNVLKKIDDKHIQVEGHTDSRPIGGVLKRKYATNWELSVARATSVTRYLVDEVNIDPSRISSTGFGEFQPVAENNTAAGRQANRRVEFALLPLRFNSGD